jgi:predicted dehydrogenase
MFPSNPGILEASSSQFEDGSFVREFAYQKRDHLLLEHFHFYDSILNNKPAIINFKDGVRAVHLVDVALRSLETNDSIKVHLG